jgi:hypothetical protein
MSYRQNYGKKMIGEKNFITNRDLQTLMGIPKPEPNNNHRIINLPEYSTNGEEFIVVKDIPECKVILNSNTTNHIIIKALTKVLIVPDKNRVDEDYDELLIDRGACVEFYFIEGNWYIGSSDGIKLG